MYDIIEAELKGVQQAIYSSRTMSTALSSSEGVALGDEPTQLRRIADAIEDHLRRVQEEKEQAIEALKQAKEESLEQLRVVQQEKDDIRAKFEEDKEKDQLPVEQMGFREAVTRALHYVSGLTQIEEETKEKEKDQLPVEQMGFREAVTRALHYVSGLTQIEEETNESQVGKLAEAIQQLQAQVTELELQAVLSSS
jgi:hypothetical protein